MDGRDVEGYSSRLIRAGTPGVADAKVSIAQQPGAETPTQKAEAEASRIIARAESLAETILARAETNARHKIEHLELEAERQREEVLSTRLMAMNRVFRREMDALRPELARLVVTAVKAILGEMPDDQRFEAQLRRALLDIEDSRSVKLLVARVDHEAVLAVVEALARAGERSISAVVPESGLEQGMCRLEAGGISLDLSLSTQLDMLEQLLLTDGDLGEFEGAVTEEINRNSGFQSEAEASP